MKTWTFLGAVAIVAIVASLTWWSAPSMSGPAMTPSPTRPDVAARDVVRANAMRMLDSTLSSNGALATVRRSDEMFANLDSATTPSALLSEIVVTEEEARNWYATNSHRLGGRGFDEALRSIHDIIALEKLRDRLLEEPRER
jgi:hypothetical protein